ncbi:peroxiredoxin [Demequina sp.]|uniref:peroxiredoxin family protein n=1 Tax=Demequina sp. TaxID=2050685 RepID=UPI0025C550FD|nr:peroxiredoxin family protein [Demequina sp.]
MTSGSTAKHQRAVAAVMDEAQALEHRGAMRERIGWLIAIVVVGALVAFALVSSRPETDTASSQASAFTLPTSDGGSVSLSDFTGEPVLLYFNEGAGCDSCLLQMAAIEANPQFADAGISVVPIVMNTADQINADRDRLGVATPFALDDGTVSEAYGTLGTGMHAGLPGHGFVLIDADGVQQWYGNYPSMWLDPEELLNIVQSELA